MITLRSSLGFSALGLLLPVANSIAQCRPPASSHEARLLAFYEAPIVFSMSQAPEPLPLGAIRIGGEAIPVPSPNPALQHPEYCYANTTNNTKLAPLFGRPRLTLGLPAAMALEASYLPNVTVDAAQATLVSVALSRTQPLPFTEKVAVAIRVDGTAGRVRGAITCPRSSLQTADANIPCFGTRPSRDTFHPNSFGAEAAVLARRADGRLSVYAGGGLRSLRPRFRAGFTDAFGNVDNTTVDVDLMRGTMFAGVTARLLDRVALSTQLYSVPADVTTIRVAAQYEFRLW